MKSDLGELMETMASLLDKADKRNLALRDVQSEVKDLKVAVKNRGPAVKKWTPGLREVQKGSRHITV
jgi:hypothetical protein